MRRSEWGSAVREIRTLRSMWRGLETWLGRNAPTAAGAPVPDPTTDEAIAAWRAEPRTTSGGQPWYSPLAILTALTLRAVFRLALRQTEGLIGSIIGLLGIHRVGLLGTMPVMRSAELADRYRDKFGFEVVSPAKGDAEAVDWIIFDELVRRDLRAPSKAEYLRVVAGLRDAGAEGVILGCTEIFLLIGQDDLPGFPVFDTTALHVAAAVRFALGDEAKAAA